MSLSIEVMRDCASNFGIFRVESASSKGKFYTVTFHGSEGQPFCDCPSYKYSQDGHCKHIAAVWNGACMYNPQWCDGHKPVIHTPIGFNYDAFADEPCPACGGKTVYVRRAV